MNLLLTNDDGYSAIGLRALAKRLAREHNVTIVAPDGEKSGASHIVHFFSGIGCKKVDTEDGIETYSVDGSPADCVIFAVKHLFKDVKFDAVLSGINTVLNIGSDIIYSGTFGAAQEATYHSLPGIALSMRTKGSEDYAFAADFVAENLDLLISLCAPYVTLNVNIPYVKREDIKGVVAAPIEYRPYVETYEMIVGEDGRERYFADGRVIKDYVGRPDGDCTLCKQGYITVTPVQLMPTDFAALENIKKETFKL